MQGGAMNGEHIFAVIMAALWIVGVIALIVDMIYFFTR